MAKFSTCLSFALVACLLITKAESGPLPTLFGGDDAIVNVGTLGNILRMPGQVLGNLSNGLTAFGSHMSGMLGDSMDSTGAMIRRTMAGVAKATDISNIFNDLPAAASPVAAAVAPLIPRDAPPTTAEPAPAAKETESSASGPATKDAEAIAA